MVQQGKVLFNLPQSASEILRADESDTVYFQVLGVKGEYLAGERDLPLPPESDDPPSGDLSPGVAPTGGAVQLRDAGVRGIDLRGGSGEDTAGIQSPCKIVCRLLLVKKKKNNTMLDERR